MKLPDGILNLGLDPTVYELRNLGHQSKLRLIKSINGLKQSPRNWNKTIDEFIVSLGFTRSDFGAVSLRCNHEGVLTFLLMYVDDILIGGLSTSVLALRDLFIRGSR